MVNLNKTGIFEKRLVEQSDIASSLEEKKEKLDEKRKELECRLNDTNIALKSLEDEITAQKKKIDSFESMFENIFKHHENATQGKTFEQTSQHHSSRELVPFCGSLAYETWVFMV